jgi:predicted nucleotidyltransferase
MNERIKQLLIQSEVFNKDGTVLKDITGYELNKFAELIVRECANVGERYADGNYEVYNQIMAHFGLEEPEE